MKDYAQLLEEAEWDGWSDFHDNGRAQLFVSKLIAIANGYASRYEAQTLGNRVMHAQISAAYRRGYQAAERSAKYASTR